MFLMNVSKLRVLICILSVDFLYGLPFESVFENELRKTLETGEPSSYLKNFAEEFELHKILSDDEFKTDSWPQAKVNQFCIACRTTLEVGLESNDADFVITNAKRICRDVFLAPETVCDGLIDVNAPEVIYMAVNYRDSLVPKDMCAFIFASNGCESDNPDLDWTVTLPDYEKPALVAEPPYPSADSVDTFKILHLSDTHIDLEYLAGANADCDDGYFCCRAESGPLNVPEDAAGYWGEYRSCDLPVRTLEVLYKHINETHPDIDFIFWTGDVVPHIVWDTSKESTLQILEEMTILIQKYFPLVPFYSAVGNHDTNVVNQFSQPYIGDPEFNMGWLYGPLVDMWSPWLAEKALLEVAIYGSFNTLIKPGLRLISVNTNFCQNINWWSLIDSNDGQDELSRLAIALQDAEHFGEKVYIIQHIAPGACFEVYSHQYNLIVSRYEATIVAMFFGHTHKDHYKLFFDPEDSSRVYDVGYVGQSQTTYKNTNPGYKIYTTEGDFADSYFRVLDHENYYFPLDVANANNITDVLFLYSAKEEYGLPDLSPQSWLDLVYTMNEPNSAEFVNFHKNYVKNGPSAYDCDDSCKHGMLCSIVNNDKSDEAPCRLNTTSSLIS